MTQYHAQESSLNDQEPTVQTHAGERFRRTARLLTTSEFNAVFERRNTTRSANFSLHKLPKGPDLFDGLESSGKRLAAKLPETPTRLGIVVPKKLLRRAVHRNQIKRLAREVFRRLANQLPQYDLIIRLHRKIDPSRLKIERRSIAGEIQGLLEKTKKRSQLTDSSI